jgi:hypothetical protein
MKNYFHLCYYSIFSSRGPALVFFPASNFFFFLHPPVGRLCAGLPRRLGPAPVRSLALAVGPFREPCPAASKEYSNASGYYSLTALRDIPLTLRILLNNTCTVARLVLSLCRGCPGSTGSRLLLRHFSCEEIIISRYSTFVFLSSLVLRRVLCRLIP